MHFEVSGEPVHTRCLSVALAQGQGESIDFRADIVDLRKGGLMELAGRIATAGIIHKMVLRGSFEAETGMIEEISWDQSHVAHEPNKATKGENCRDPMARLKDLVGTRLGEGFASELKGCFGGPLGCTHINTLFQELSAVVARLQVLRGDTAFRFERRPGERIASRSVFLDAAIPTGGAEAAISVRLTDLHFAALDAQGNEHVYSHDEVRLVATAELATWQLRGVQAGERCRRAPSFADTSWTSRTDELGDFSDRSLGGGMARFCLEHFGDRDDDARLLSALLSLGPGMTQIGAALSDALVPSSATRPSSARPMGSGPCYMLRAEGPLMATLFPGGTMEEESE